MTDRCYSWFSRVFFFVAFILMVVAIWDWVLRLFGYTLPWLHYQPGRLFEFAAIMLIFVITVLLRQIRDAVRKK
jgi:hypothetical protein